MTVAKNGEVDGLVDETPVIRKRRPTKGGEFASFLFNRKEKTFCGRTVKSWIAIVLFYVVFYICLAAFWIGCLAIFLGTLNPKMPRFHGPGSISGIHPGVGYQPWLKEQPDSTLIKFNLRDPRTWKPYTDQLSRYLQKYDDANDTRECGPTENNWDASSEESNLLACRFPLTVFEENGCNAENEFGYRTGQPCVIISLNKLILWEPVDYTDVTIPEAVRGRYKSGSIAINCDGAHQVDREHIGNITYIPEYGIDGKYLPYFVLPNFHQPIAMIRFDSLPRNKLVLVECRAYADNIQHDIEQKLGLVHFEIFVQDKAVKGLRGQQARARLNQTATE